MRTQSMDTSPEAERVQIKLLRKASPAKRFALARSLSQSLIQASRKTIQGLHPDLLVKMLKEIHYLMYGLPPRPPYTVPYSNPICPPTLPGTPLGAPQAVQCADRFHLAQNLTGTVEAILARCRAEICKAWKTENHTLPERPDASSPLAGSDHLARHAERSDRYHQLVELQKEGRAIKEIARRLGMAERTARYWFKRGIPYGKPELRRKRRSGFAPSIPYVTERWQQGERNGLRIFRELQAQGFKGGSSTLYRFLRSLRGYSASPQGKAERAQAVPEVPLQDFSAKEAVWLFVRPPADLAKTERQDLALICQATPTATLVYELVQDFMEMLRYREGERLDGWLESARASHIREPQGFARSIE